MESEIKIVSQNVAGLLNLVKHNRVSTFLRQQKVDVIYLQETHLKPWEVKRLHHIYCIKVMFIMPRLGIDQQEQW